MPELDSKPQLCLGVACGPDTEGLTKRALIDFHDCSALARPIERGDELEPLMSQLNSATWSLLWSGREEPKQAGNIASRCVAGEGASGGSGKEKCRVGAQTGEDGGSPHCGGRRPPRPILAVLRIDPLELDGAEGGNPVSLTDRIPLKALNLRVAHPGESGDNHVAGCP